MGDNDASVCRLLHEGKQFYDTRMPFTSVINREYMTSVRNPIISPGQVLIKKNKIPELWKHARLKNNGADDWLLWLCMLGENSSFALNPEILFEHVVDGHNESMNMKHMMDSEEEMYHVLSAGGIFSDKELECVHNAVRNAAREHINTLCRFQKMFFVYETWIRLWEDGLYLHDYLKQNGIRSVAVYAAGYIGRRLYDSLKKSGTRVLYFIDINAKYLRMDIPVYLPDMCLPDVDMIIVSLLEEERGIIKKLSSVSDAQICSVTKLLNDVGGMNHGREI